MSRKNKVLAVDDEGFNLAILQSYLKGAGFEVVTAGDGDTALQKFQEHPDIDIVLLDRMMPRLNGMEVLKKMKADARLRDIPVVMQTAAANSEQILEGIEAGVYYYLTKPFEEAMLLGIVQAALRDTQAQRESREEARKQKRVLAGLMESAHFRFRTLDEAKNLAYFIAGYCPNPQTAIYGLSEIMINAVEHGNLGITYKEKTKLVREGDWEAEVQRRLQQPQNIDKYASLSFALEKKQITLRIRDQGQGFDWRNYLEVSPQRATDPHGRGIAISKMMSFSTMAYQGSGNDVICTVALT